MRTSNTNPLIIFYGVMIIVGSIIGVMIVDIIGSNNLSALTDISNSYITARGEGKLISILISTTAINIFIAVIIVVCGMVKNGCFITMLLAITKGVIYSVIAVTVFVVSGSSYTYILVTVVPFHILSSLGIIYLCRASTIQSLASKNKQSLSKYIKACLPLLSFIALSSIIEGLLVFFICPMFG